MTLMPIATQYRNEILYHDGGLLGEIQAVGRPRVACQGWIDDVSMGGLESTLQPIAASGTEHVFTK